MHTATPRRTFRRASLRSAGSNAYTASYRTGAPRPIGIRTTRPSSFAAVVRSLLKDMTANPCRAVQCRREYLALFDEMYELAGRGESLTAEEIALARVLASMIILEFPRQNCRRKSVPARADRADIADKLIGFMEAHYMEQLSI